MHPVADAAEGARRMLGDEDLRALRAAGTGDGGAFARVYERYAGMVHAVIVAAGRAADADDLTQETFLKALRKAGQVREGTSLGPWLAAVARNEARQSARGLRRALRRMLGLARARRAELPDQSAEIIEVIAGLPEAYRETVAMRLVANMKGEEIAARAGMTHESVRVNLSRGMALLRERMAAIEGATRKEQRGA